MQALESGAEEKQTEIEIDEIGLLGHVFLDGNHSLPQIFDPK